MHSCLFHSCPTRLELSLVLCSVTEESPLYQVHIPYPFTMEINAQWVRNTRTLCWIHSICYFRLYCNFTCKVHSWKNKQYVLSPQAVFRTLTITVSFMSPFCCFEPSVAQSKRKELNFISKLSVIENRIKLNLSLLTV